MGCWSLDSLEPDEFIVKVQRCIGDTGEQYLIAQRLDNGHLFHAGYLDNSIAAVVDEFSVVFAIGRPEGTGLKIQEVLDDRNVKYYQIDLAFDLINSA